MFPKKTHLIFALSVILIGFGCGGSKTPEVTPEIASNDEALFRLGEQFIEKDPEKGRLYMRQVMDSFPKSFYAQRAKLAIADSYFRKGDEGSMIIAAAEYGEFISLYPISPSAAYAQHQLAMTYYKKVLKPGRDQMKTKNALAEFKKVTSLYPESEEAKLAAEKILDCEERLAEHILYIGEHYYKVKAFKASTSRLLDILTSYPNFGQMDKVYYYLADSYYGWDKVDQALPYFTKLVSDYPESKYAEKAVEKLEEIDKKNNQKDHD